MIINQKWFAYYKITSKVIGVISFILGYIAMVMYAADHFGWFLGIPLGLVIGLFFAALIGIAGAALWPLAVVGIAAIFIDESGILDYRPFVEKKELISTAVPSIPDTKPGMNTLAACFLIAANTYSVPPAVLLGIYQQVGGRIGKSYLEKDGETYYGPMKNRAKDLPELTAEWKVSRETAIDWMMNDPCTNVGVAGWEIRRSLNDTGSLDKAIAEYGAHRNLDAKQFFKDVKSSMLRNGLLKGSKNPAGFAD